jgi:hypothetical protein
MIMNAKTIYRIVSGAVIAGALGFAWRTRRVNEVATMNVTALRTQQSAQVASLKKRQAELERNEKERAALQAEARAARPKSIAATAPTAPTPQEKFQKLTQNPMELIAKDPKLQLLYLASKRASVATTYGPLFYRLKLSPEQIDRLAAAMTRAEEQQQDMAAIQREQNLKPDDPALAKLRQQTNDELAMVQLEVLGSEGAADLKQYQRTLTPRTIAGRFAGAATLAGVPLTGPQVEQLTQAIVRATEPRESGGRVDMPKIDWAAADADAASILSAAQLALFQRIEPLGGGTSRWNTELNRALAEALADARKTMSAAKLPGN